MSETTNLKLKKHDNVETNTNEFDVEEYLNGNWDKVDEAHGEQNTKIETNSTEIETLKAENKRLQQENLDFKNTLPSGVENGESVTLEDSADMTFKKLQISGNTWQETSDDMPSAEFISTIKSCKDSIDFTICNKNLYNRETCTENKAITWKTGLLINEEKSITTDYIRVHANQKIVQNYKSQIFFYDKNKTCLGFLKTNGEMENIGSVLVGGVTDKYKIPDNSSIYYVRLGFRSNSNENIDMLSAKIKVEENNIATNYEEHKEQNITFPLKQRLHTGDYLAEDEIHHVRKEIELDGVTNGLKINTVVKHTNDIYYCTVVFSKTAINASKAYCSHFKNSNKVGVETGNCYITGGGGVLVLVLEDQTITTASQANNWLAQQKANGTPVTVNYLLAVEELEEYSTEQKEAYNKLMQARSYKEKTHIYSIDPISPVFDVEYCKDLELFINSKLNAAAVAETEE